MYHQHNLEDQKPKKTISAQQQQSRKGTLCEERKKNMTNHGIRMGTV